MAKDNDKDALPEPIQKFLKRREDAEKLIKTTSLYSKKAYIEAVEKFLMDENGNIDYNKLKDDDIRKNVGDKIADSYLANAKKQLGIEKDLDQTNEDIVLLAYSKTTRSRIHDILNKTKDDFTYDVFSQNHGELMDSLRNDLYSAAASHISLKHKEDVIKHAGIEEIVEKDLLDENNIRQILNASYQAKGKLNYSTLKQVVGNYKVKDQA